MLSGIILGGGTSSRMGECKQLLELGDKPLIQHVIDNLTRSELDEVILVLGHMAQEIHKRISPGRAKVILNPHYRDGISTSLKTGLEKVDIQAKGILIALADQPLISYSTINRLIEAYKTSKAEIVVPYYRGRRGNPVLFSRSLMHKLLQISGDMGARKIIQTHRNLLLRLEVKDPGVLIDIDTPEDLLRAQETYSMLRR